MKEKVTFSIDEKLMEMVRDNIPNKSEFVEDCFKAYLTFAIENEEDRGEELRKAWKEFHDSKLKIHLLMKVDYEGKDLEQIINKQKTDAWLNVWSDYRRVGNTQDFKLEKSSKILEITIPELKKVLDDTLSKAELDRTKMLIFDDWKYIEEIILPHIELYDDEEDALDALLKREMDTIP